MRRSIATVSLSGMLREKLQAIAAAGFDGVEIFENDLLQFSGRPREVRAIAADLGLAIDMFQPFRDFDAATPAQVARNLDRLERKFDVMDELGTDLVLVCSNVQVDAPGDAGALAEQFGQLAARAARRGKRVAYEALAWGTRVNRFAQAWEVVKRVDHPNLGLALDSFHTLAVRDDPRPIARLPGEKIFYVQLADAPWVSTDVLTHSRHYRCFPGQGELDLVGFMNALLDSGYTGTISLEIFNDEFRAAPARATALDAMRSLLWLEEQVRASRAGAPATRVPLFVAPAPTRFDGWAFIEFAADPPTARALAAYFASLGFSHLGRHRSKDVDLYGAGEVRLVINREEDSFARSYFDLHGPSVCALALTADDAHAAFARAEALLCNPFAGAIGPGELAIPAVIAPDGGLLYFCPARDGRAAFEADFTLERDPDARPGTRARVDHITQALPRGQLEPWLLFQRGVLGLLSQRNTILHDPYGAVRSREFESGDKAIRTSLIVSERDHTAVARSIERYHGAGVQQIAIAVDDVIAFAGELRRRGAPLLPVPDNYYDDLEARYALAPAFLHELRASGVLYERDGEKEFLHVYAAPFEDRFEFEFVERRGGYQLYGSTNAPVRLAALAEWRAAHESAALP
ncbi:MAG TPA: TIM barrel protein [Burkholderiaceae bacterium]|nr:TIM barrel protein [Burkholderiaceae bacterium]